MSWWDVGEGKVIGDGPADAIVIALSDVARERTEAGRPKPSLESVLGAMATAVAGDGDEAPRIVASLAGGGEVESGRAGGDVVVAIRECLVEIERQYEERWDRPPNLSELGETLLFVLTGAAESLLRDGDRLEVDAIEVES